MLHSNPVHIMLLGSLDAETVDTLHRRGAEVRRVDRVAHAQRQLASSTVDLLLVDLFLPEMDGLSALQRLKHSQPRLPPSVLMTPPAIDPPLSTAPDIRATLRKPIPTPALLHLIHSLVAPAQQRSADGHPGHRPSLDQNETSAGGDEDRNTPEPARVVIDLDQPIREARKAFMRAYLRYKIDQAGGCMRHAARSAQMDYSAFYRQCNALGLRAKAVKSCSPRPNDAD
jgi:DNA-binding NtrC family response regulator